MKKRKVIINKEIFLSYALFSLDPRREKLQEVYQ